MADSSISDHKCSINLNSESALLILKNTSSNQIWDKELNDLLAYSISIGIAKIVSSGVLEGHGVWTSETTKEIFEDHLTVREQIFKFCEMLGTKHISCYRVVRCIDIMCGTIIPWKKKPKCQTSLVTMVCQKVGALMVKKDT